MIFNVKMLRFFSRYGWNKLNFILIVIVLPVFIFLYKFSNGNESIPEIKRSNIASTPNTIRTHDFHLYPESRSFLEYTRIQIDNVAQSMFMFNKSECDQSIVDSKPIEYSESKFRSAPFPIIWLDKYGDVHWNRAAQYEALNYLLEKQFPNENISSCLSRQLFMLEQWSMGFFSRHHCLIEQFGQTLYSPSMTLLVPRRLVVSNSGADDFGNEGILRYYQSISLCSAYLNHPVLKTLRDRVQSVGFSSPDTKVINNVNQLLERDESKFKFKYSAEIWKFGYDHVPHRRWLFDRNRNQIKRIINYNSPVHLLIDHSNEHIYYYNKPSFNLTAWSPRNAPQGPPKDVLPGSFLKSLPFVNSIFTSRKRNIGINFFYWKF